MVIGITGASGHIGNNLCRELIKRGHHVKVLIHTSDKSLADLDVEKVKGNILDNIVVNKLVEGTDFVYHTAAIISIGSNSKENVFKVNIEGTRNVIEACISHKIKRLIHFSSIHALRNLSSDLMLNEDNPLVGTEAFNYDQSKANSELLVIDGCKRGLNAIILNPSGVIGPFDYIPSLMGQMIIEIAEGKMPFLIKGGYHWADVRDVVDAAINAMELGRNGERYLLTNQWKSLVGIASLICTQVKRKEPTIIPNFLAWAGLPFINIYSKITGTEALYTKESLTIVAHSPKMVNNQKAISELNFKPRPIEETFTDSLSWFLNNGYLKIKNPKKDQND